MNWIFKWLKRKRFYIFLSVGISLFFIYDFLELRLSNHQLISALSENTYNYQAEIHYFDTLKRKVRYVEIGDDSKPLLIFIHGAPSSSSFWLKYLKDSFLLSQYKMIAPDRPGYGYSGFGKSLTSVEKQAAILSKLLKEKKKLHQKIFLHGSSYGGTLAARLAMDYPNLIDGIVLQSASLAPQEEKIYSISYPIKNTPLKWVIPTSLRIANEEKMSHEKQLNQMLPLWKKIIVPVIILHGTKDNLIYPSNATFAKNKLINSPFVDLIWAKDKGHDLAWTRRDLLIQSLDRIFKIAKKLKNKSEPSL